MKLFRLQLYPLERAPLRFRAIATAPNESTADSEVSLPFLDDEADRRFTVVKMLEATQFRRADFPAEEERDWMVRAHLLHPDQDGFQQQWLKRIGQLLYDSLGNEIQALLQASLAQAKQQGVWLHVRLEFPQDAPKFVRLTDYPWEIMADDREHLALQGATFSRYITYRSPAPNIAASEALNVLLVASRAGDPLLGLEALPNREAAAIATGLEHATAQGKIHLEKLPAATQKALRERLMRHSGSARPHVLHFDGHGYFGRRCDRDGCGRMHKPVGIERCEACQNILGAPQGYLLFEDEVGGPDYISARELGELLGNLALGEVPDSPQGIVLAVLSGCKTGLSLLQDSVFNGVAQNLISQGIPAVVAMQYSVSVGAAGNFAEAFYQSLGKAESVAIALRRGQSAMGIEGQQWYRPVLYLRWMDNEGGQLFLATAHDARPPNLVSEPSGANDMQSEERLALNRTLNQLPMTQFDELVMSLNPPAGILPPNIAAQGNRTPALLQWVEGPTGSKLPKLQAMLKLILVIEETSTDDISQTQMESSAPSGKPLSEARRRSYKRRKAELEADLKAAESDLAKAPRDIDRRRLEKEVEDLLTKIEELEEQLNG